jgi:hypothetical protein
MITRTTGYAGQQHARSSGPVAEPDSMSSCGGLLNPGALQSAPVSGNLGFMTQASTGGVPAP